MTFASDNWTGAADVVMAALAQANAGAAPAYGGDEWTERARRIIGRTFETEVGVLFTATGTAANAIALAHVARPGGVVIGHVDSHIVRDEAGAPGYFSPGLMIDTVDGADGKLHPQAVAELIARYGAGDPRHGRFVALSLTNVNELGQVYTPAEVAALARPAKAAGAKVHMDGARFFNAVVTTGASPADLTWRQGVDILSLGLTKAGAWCAEAIVFFDPTEADEAAFRHKQAAQLLSKSRFVAAQVVALLERADVEALCADANRSAAHLADTIMASGEAELALAPAANEVFAFVSPRASERMNAAQILAYPWSVRSAHKPLAPAEGWTLRRFVTSFRTSQADLSALSAALA